jgi:NAD(P)-dependent dehydrogenase (short-subunit alcohol dehydrogenase family)
MSQKVVVTAAASGVGLEVARPFAAVRAKISSATSTDKRSRRLKRQVPPLSRSYVYSNRSGIEAMARGHAIRHMSDRWQHAHLGKWKLHRVRTVSGSEQRGAGGLDRLR